MNYPGRPNSTSETLKESKDKDLRFSTTENATTYLFENGTFDKYHISTSATNQGPNKVAIFVPTSVTFVVVIGVAGIALLFRRTRNKKKQIASDDEMQFQVLHICIYIDNY